MVEQSGEPLLLSFLCCLPHTVQSLGHALPALCRVHVRLNDVLPRLYPSLPSLRRRLSSLVRLVHRYYGAVRLLQHVHVRRAACGLRGPALIIKPRRTGDLPVLVHVVSQRARVLRLRRTDNPLAMYVAAVLPSSYSEWSRHPDLRAFVGSRTGAMLRRCSLAVAPRFLWECLTSQTVSWFPAPATSNVACGFPALRSPVGFKSRFM